VAEAGRAAVQDVARYAWGKPRPIAGGLFFVLPGFWQVVDAVSRWRLFVTEAATGSTCITPNFGVDCLFSPATPECGIGATLLCKGLLP
jgi:hypothetical protein